MKTHNPDIIILIEIKVNSSRAQDVIQTLKNAPIMLKFHQKFFFFSYFPPFFKDWANVEAYSRLSTRNHFL